MIFHPDNLALAHTDVIYLTKYLKIDIWVYICIFLHLSLMISFIPRSENTSSVFKVFDLCCQIYNDAISSNLYYR